MLKWFFMKNLFLCQTATVTEYLNPACKLMKSRFNVDSQGEQNNLSSNNTQRQEFLIPKNLVTVRYFRLHLLRIDNNDWFCQMDRPIRVF